MEENKKTKGELLNRFGDKIKKQENLKFDYDLGEVMLCKDGIPRLITGFGIYDNQYWTESYYPDGIHLGAGNHISDREIVAQSKDIKQIRIILKAYIKIIEDNCKEFFLDIPKAIKQTEVHLSFYKNLLEKYGGGSNQCYYCKKEYPESDMGIWKGERICTNCERKKRND